MSLHVKAGKGRPSGTLIKQAYDNGREDGYQEAMKAMAQAFDFVRWQATRQASGHQTVNDVFGNESPGGGSASESGGLDSTGQPGVFSS